MTLRFVRLRIDVVTHRHCGNSLDNLSVFARAEPRASSNTQPVRNVLRDVFRLSVLAFVVFA